MCNYLWLIHGSTLLLPGPPLIRRSKSGPVLAYVSVRVVCLSIECVYLCL